MTDLHETVRRVGVAIRDAFDRLDAWFDRPETVRAFRPADGGWTGTEVLEHVALTTYYLLVIIRRQATRAVRKSASGAQLHADEHSSLERLDAIGDPGAFRWIRPEHMEPTGTVPANQIRTLLRQQRDECLAILETLGHGEGRLVSVRMSVNALGKMDLYQWLMFVAQHANRHLKQLDGNEEECVQHAG